MAIDPGSKKIGIALIDDFGSRMERVWSETIFLRGRDKPARLAHVDNTIHETITRHKPHAVAVESGFVGRGWQTSLVIAESRGAAMAGAARAGRPVIEVAPSEAKKAIGLKGNADKGEVRVRMRVWFGMELMPAEDEADALAIAICAAGRVGRGVYGSRNS